MQDDGGNFVFLLVVVGLGAVALWLLMRKQAATPATQPCGVPVSYAGVGTVVPCTALKEVPAAVYNAGVTVGSAIPHSITNNVLGGSTSLPDDGGHILARAMCDCYNEKNFNRGTPLIISSAQFGQLSSCQAVAKLAPGIICKSGDCDCHPVVLPDPAPAGRKSLTGTIKWAWSGSHGNKIASRYDLTPAKITALNSKPGVQLSPGNLF